MFRKGRGPFFTFRDMGPGKGNMGTQFMSGTPLAGLEREMGQANRFAPMASGSVGLCLLSYRPEDQYCRLCLERQKQRGDPRLCPSGARAEALPYQELVRLCFQDRTDPLLWNRIKAASEQTPYFSYADAGHLLRFRLCLKRLDRAPGKRVRRDTLAALYLLTATSSLWRSVEVWRQKRSEGLPGGFSLDVGGQDYVLYQTAKRVRFGDRGITERELADRKLVSADALRLAVNSGLIARYGLAALDKENGVKS